MEQSSNRTVNARSSALKILAIISGILTYIPVYLFISKDYLIPGDRYFINDMFLFIVSVAVVVVCLFTWKAIHKQFKNDKTRLGFALDKSGTSLTIEIIIEAVVTFLIIHFSSSGLWL